MLTGNSIFNSILTKIKSTSEDALSSSSVIPNLSGITLLDEYHVDGKLPVSGAEADIYSAHMDDNSRFVVKLYKRRNSIKPGIIDSLTHLKNLHVVSISGSGEYAGYTYTVSPYYDGTSLDRIIEGGTRFDIGTVKSMLLPAVLDGLKALHDAGIIHKDLKPANIMITPADNGIRIIDFGISSELDQSTLIVTKTGKTPAYSAPETLSGVFSVESDYFSLGITLYELMTGHTPFERNLTDADVINQSVQIRSIEFPDYISEEARNLILGLTYRDISNRHDRNNPNRRWGYEEVKRWLDGESVQVPGISVDTGSSATDRKDFRYPYKFRGALIENISQLAEALLRDYGGGLRELQRGLLERHFELNENYDFQKKCSDAARKIENTDNDDVSKACIYSQLCYEFDPDFSDLYWRGNYFGSLKEFAGKLQNELQTIILNNSDAFDPVLTFLSSKYRNDKSDKKSIPVSSASDFFDALSGSEFLTSVSEMIGSGFLEFFIKLRAKDLAKQNEKTLVSHIVSLKKLFGKNNIVTYLGENNTLNVSQSLENLTKLLTLSSLITSRTDFVACSKHFENSGDFQMFMKSLYEKDLLKYVSLFRLWYPYLTRISACITDLTDILYKFKLLADNVFSMADDRYQFKSPGDVLSYEDKLWNTDRIDYFLFRRMVENDYNARIEEMKKTDSQLFEQNRTRYEGMFALAGIIYESPAQLVSYIRDGYSVSPDFAVKFLASRMDEIRSVVQTTRSDTVKNALEKLLKIESYLHSNVNVDQTIRKESVSSNNESKDQSVNELLDEILHQIEDELSAPPVNSDKDSKKSSVKKTDKNISSDPVSCKSSLSDHSDSEQKSSSENSKSHNQISEEDIKPGNIVKGKVSRFVKYGAFIDIGGFTGLLHLKDMSGSNIKSPEEILKIGEEIDVRVLKVERKGDNFHISLSLKPLIDWNSIAGKYTKDSVFDGRVVKIMDYGCFVELQDGVVGLVHKSEIDPDGKNVKPSDVVEVGQPVKVRILWVDAEKKRIALSFRNC